MSKPNELLVILPQSTHVLIRWAQASYMLLHVSMPSEMQPAGCGHPQVLVFVYLALRPLLCVCIGLLSVCQAAGSIHQGGSSHMRVISAISTISSSGCLMQEEFAGCCSGECMEAPRLLRPPKQAGYYGNWTIYRYGLQVHTCRFRCKCKCKCIHLTHAVASRCTAGSSHSAAASYIIEQGSLVQHPPCRQGDQDSHRSNASLCGGSAMLQVMLAS